MNKGKRKAIGAFAVLSVALGLILFSSPNEGTIKSDAAGFKFIPRTIEHYSDDPNSDRDQNLDTPAYFTFNSEWTDKNGNQSPQYKAYGGDRKFYEEVYKDRFHWYSIVPPRPKVNKSVDETDMSQMLENRQTDDGHNGYWLADPYERYGWSLNLKTGSATPGQQNYNGYDSGTTYLYSGPFKGHYFEWRYLGYSPDGIPVENPYFPADVLAGGKWSVFDPRKYEWVKYPWTVTDPKTKKALIEKTELDDDEAQKKEWFKKYLIPQNPMMMRNGMSLDESADYWASRLSVRVNPELSSGVVTGFNTGRYGNGYWYATFVMDSPPKPNLRLVEYTVTDKETGKLMGKFTRNPNDNSDESRRGREMSF